MAITHSGICAVIGLLLSVSAKGIRADCESQSIESPIDGHACLTHEYSNISVTDSHHCTLACIQKEECKATVYDVGHSVCMLLPQLCMLLRPRADFVYQAFHYPCTKWVPQSDDTPGYWIYEVRIMSYIARSFIDDDLVVGKMTNVFNTVHPSETYAVTATHYEKLVVDPTCQVTWVSYDATTGQPLPGGALIGGFLSATNTPLYVSRLTTSGIYVVGYYDPLNRQALGELGGVIRDTIFDLMVVKLLPT